MFTLEDLQSFCDDLSQWIIELDSVDELHKAGPREFPLKPDPDDLEDTADVLAYLILWMCCKHKIKAPPHLESRMILAKFKGPWQELYIKLDYKAPFLAS